MARRVSRFRGGAIRVPQRRKTEWGSLISSGEWNIAAASSKLLVGSFSSATLAPLVPMTLSRVRGVFSHRSDQATADETYAGAVGICVVQDAARAAGVASVPGPVTEVGQDMWLWWMPFVGRFEFGSASGFVLPFVHQIVDNRAMRKIEDGNAIVMVIETAAFGQGVSGAFFLRFLFKMH